MRLLPALMPKLTIQVLLLPWVRDEAVDDLMQAPGGCVVCYGGERGSWSGDDGALIDLDRATVTVGDGVDDYNGICRSVGRLYFLRKTIQKQDPVESFLEACGEVSLEFVGGRTGLGRRFRAGGEWVVDERGVRGRLTQTFNHFYTADLSDSEEN